MIRVILETIKSILTGWRCGWNNQAESTVGSDLIVHYVVSNQNLRESQSHVEFLRAQFLDLFCSICTFSMTMHTNDVSNHSYADDPLLEIVLSPKGPLSIGSPTLFFEGFRPACFEANPVSVIANPNPGSGVSSQSETGPIQSS